MSFEVAGNREKKTEKRMPSFGCLVENRFFFLHSKKFVLTFSPKFIDFFFFFILLLLK